MNPNPEDEFVAVRVQDPRIQNEGSWNSFVDFKIFLHTNSPAFTAKTSCVRRRYSEFVWLKKKLQKNAGLVPVPDLPGKSFFSFSSEDFLERRRRGLQAFLDKVATMTVCLSDSQLHLFLQTQLPVGHIQDCVQGHTPYSVTDAILTYASSNWGLAQAQEDDSIKEPSLTVSYESMESPAPHQPCLQTAETSRPLVCGDPDPLVCGDPDPLVCGDSDPLVCGDSDPLVCGDPDPLVCGDSDPLVCGDPDPLVCGDPDPLVCGDPDPLAGLLDEDETQGSSVKIWQKRSHLVVVEREATGATFYLGDRPGLAEQSQQVVCQRQTPAEVHSSMRTGVHEDCEDSSERVEALGREDKTVKADGVLGASSPQEANLEHVSCEPEQCPNPVVLLDFKDNVPGEKMIGSNDRSQEDAVDVVCSERRVLETEFDPADITEVSGVPCEDDLTKSDSEDSSETVPQAKIQIETDHVKKVPEVGRHSTAQPAVQDVDLDGTKDESEEDTHSLSSSNESIVKVSDEESCDEAEAANGFLKMSDGDVSSRDILDLQMNGFPVEEDDLRYLTPLDLNATTAGGDLTESGDFSVLESS